MCFSLEHPDRRADLPFVEATLLWSMRAWAIGMRCHLPVEERIDDVLARIGAANATGQIYGFMWVVGYGALRTIEVDCVCNPKVSRDERRLLATVALAQQSRHSDAIALLRSLVTVATTNAALDGAVRIARCLTAAGRSLSPDWTPAGRLSPPFESRAGLGRMTMTVH